MDTNLTSSFQLKKTDLFDLLVTYALDKHKQDLMNILENQNKDMHFPVIVHFLELVEKCPKICEAILSNFFKYSSLFDSALAQATKNLFESMDADEQENCSLKNNIHLRVWGLPIIPEVHLKNMPKLKDFGKFLCIQGTVLRATQTHILEYMRELKCNKCCHEFIVKGEFEEFYIIHPPPQCPNPTINCKSTTFQPVEKKNPLFRRDYQEIKLQEPLHKLSVGAVPQSVWVTLDDDLTSLCKPGDDVFVYGQVKRRWQPLVRDQRSVLEIVVKGNFIKVINEPSVQNTTVINQRLGDFFTNFWTKSYANAPLAGRNLILSSFSPQIYGVYVVKLATAVVLAGGVSRMDESGSKTRGESHLLLIGDPGNGKSQVLKYVSKLSPRSVLTTGIGTSSAGLTVAAVKDSGLWHLEAGALVLADGGVCCIDEFNSIQERDRASILESMEQQTISVAKAGMVCKLNTRCSIIAATNAKGGHYDCNLSLSVNAGLASPLLSRFDLILVLVDKKDSVWDEIVSSYILNGNCPHNNSKTDSDLWPFDMMKSYFSMIKNLKPTLTQSANRILSKYYYTQRQNSDRSTARTTVRMLESLIRLSQGHARLMYRNEVTVMDAVVAVTLMESSMMSTALIAAEDTLHSSFPVDAMAEYQHQVKVVLTRLDLLDILASEIERLKIEASRIIMPREAYPDDEKNMLEEKEKVHIDQTQRILATINQKKNQKIALQEENEANKIKTTLKRKRFSKSSTKVEAQSKKAKVNFDRELQESFSDSDSFSDFDERSPVHESNHSTDNEDKIEETFLNQSSFDIGMPIECSTQKDYSKASNAKELFVYKTVEEADDLFSLNNI